MNNSSGKNFPVQESTSLKEIALLFLKLGIIGFGGPAVHIAMMEEEVVRKRKWMSAEHFLDLVGATNLIPGPNSTEMTMHIGRERGGWKGLVIAGSCFIIPAVIITAVIAWAYQVYGHLPAVRPFLYGIKPAVIALIAVTMIRLGHKAFKNLQLVIIGLLCAAAVLAGFNEIIILFAAGLLGILMFLFRPKTLNGMIPFTLMQVTQFLDLSSLKIFIIFLKIGAILYGSGYVLFAFLDAELVSKGWLTKQQLTDAIAVGQVTPGPVFSSATFIGWQLGGTGGALAATIGIFLPAFIFVAILNPLLPALRRSPVMSAFLDTVNVASIAIIFAVLVEMGKESIQDWRTILIALAGGAAVFIFRKINPAIIIAAGALLGYVLLLI